MQGKKTHEQQLRTLERKPDVPDARRAEAELETAGQDTRARTADKSVRDQLHQWEAAGYDRAFIEDYLGSNADSYNHPNAAIEPRIPGIFQYYSIAEDELVKGMSGQYKSAQETADAIAAAWEKITDQIGRENQIKLYKASLGM